MSIQKNLTALFIGVSVLGCGVAAEAEKVPARQQQIYNEVLTKLNAIAQAQKPYMSPRRYLERQKIDRCDARNIAVYKYAVEQFLEVSLPELAKKEKLTPQHVDFLKEEINDREAIQTLAIMMACEQGMDIIPNLSAPQPK